MADDCGLMAVGVDNYISDAPMTLWDSLAVYNISPFGVEFGSNPVCKNQAVQNSPLFGQNSFL